MSVRRVDEGGGEDILDVSRIDSSDWFYDLLRLLENGPLTGEVAQEVDRIEKYIHRQAPTALTGFGERWRTRKSQEEANSLFNHAIKWSRHLILISSFQEHHSEACASWETGEKWRRPKLLFSHPFDVFTNGCTNPGWVKFIELSGLDAISLRCLFDISPELGQVGLSDTNIPAKAVAQSARSPEALLPPRDLAPPRLPTPPPLQHASSTSPRVHRPLPVRAEHIADTAHHFGSSEAQLIDILQNYGDLLSQGLPSSEARDTPGPSQAQQPGDTALGKRKAAESLHYAELDHEITAKVSRTFDENSSELTSLVRSTQEADGHDQESSQATQAGAEAQAQQPSEKALGKRKAVESPYDAELDREVTAKVNRTFDEVSSELTSLVGSIRESDGDGQELSQATEAEAEASNDNEEAASNEDEDEDEEMVESSEDDESSEAEESSEDDSTRSSDEYSPPPKEGKAQRYALRSASKKDAAASKVSASKRLPKPPRSSKKAKAGSSRKQLASTTVASQEGDEKPPKKSGKPQLYAGTRETIVERHVLDCGNCSTFNVRCEVADLDSHGERCKTCVSNRRSNPPCEHKYWLQPGSIRMWAELVQGGTSEAEADCMVYGTLEVFGHPRHDKITDYSSVDEAVRRKYCSKKFWTISPDSPARHEPPSASASLRARAQSTPRRAPASPFHAIRGVSPTSPLAEKRVPDRSFDTSRETPSDSRKVGAGPGAPEHIRWYTEDAEPLADSDEFKRQVVQITKDLVHAFAQHHYAKSGPTSARKASMIALRDAHLNGLVRLCGFKDTWTNIFGVAAEETYDFLDSGGSPKK